MGLFVFGKRVGYGVLRSVGSGVSPGVGKSVGAGGPPVGKSVGAADCASAGATKLAEKKRNAVQRTEMMLLMLEVILIMMRGWERCRCCLLLALSD